MADALGIHRLNFGYFAWFSGSIFCGCSWVKSQSGRDWGGHLDRVPDRGDAADEAAVQKTIQTVQTCLDRLRTRNEIAFILAWHAEGNLKARLERVGYTFEAALCEIGEFLAAEVRSDLCV